MKKQKINFTDLILLGSVILLAFVFRLYKINAPIADLHSWRQADTAAVARNFSRDGIDILHPRYDDLSGRESGKENPEGYRMVEFPVYNALIVFSQKLIPALSLDIHARLISIYFSLITIGVIYYLLFKEVNRMAAFSAGFIYAIFPFFVFFSRVVLPEPTAVGFGMLAIFFLYLSTDKEISRPKETILLILSAVCFALGLLVKPTVAFYGLVLVYLWFKKHGYSSLKKVSFYIYFLLSVVPFFLWRMYIKNFPEGIPASDWLLTSVNTYEGLKTIFLRPAFFRWIFFERLNHMIFGGYLSIFFLLGILKKSSRFFFHSLLTASFLYLFVFEGGNVQHEYYQTIILPAIAIFIGLGIEFLWSLRRNLTSPVTVVAVSLIVICASFFFSYYIINEFYKVPGDLTTIAKIIRTITRPEDKIVTDRLGDTTLLYLADRKGWPNYSGNLDVLKDKGYKYFVTANKDLIAELRMQRTYKPIFDNDQFTIFAL